MFKKIKGSMVEGGAFSLVFLIFSLLILLNTAHAQTVRITSPNGGEVWTAGENKNITWTFSGAVADAKVELVLLQGWNQIGVIVSNISIGSGGAGSWTWKVGQYQGGNLTSGSGYKIRMKIVGRDWVRDESDQPFGLVRASAITSGTTAVKADSQPVKPKSYQQDPGTMPKASLERPPDESTDSYKLHGPMPNVKLLSLEIVGQGNRTKPFPNEGTVELERNDVTYGSEEDSTYVLRIRLNLTNSGTREAQDTIQLFLEVDGSEYCLNNKNYQFNINLKPGETKTYTREMVLFACDHPTRLSIIHRSGGSSGSSHPMCLFVGYINCGRINDSKSLISWLGGLPLLWMPAIWTKPEKPISGQKAKAYCNIRNHGGSGKTNWWSITFNISHPRAGSIFSKKWEFNDFFPKSNLYVQEAEFTTSWGGDEHLFVCTLEAARPIIFDAKLGWKTKDFQYKRIKKSERRITFTTQ